MIAGIVLAAGRSTRMGRPKAMLRLGGASFVERAVRALADGGCAGVWVVVAADSEPALTTLANAAGARVVVNPREISEQLHSLQAGLGALGPEVEAAIVLPVDVPTVGAELVSRLIDGFRAGEAAVVLPTVGGAHGHPVLFARSVWPELMDPSLVDGARQVVHAHVSDRLEIPVAALASDVDTPEDYERLVRS